MVRWESWHRLKVCENESAAILAQAILAQGVVLIGAILEGSVAFSVGPQGMPLVSFVCVCAYFVVYVTFVSSHIALFAFSSPSPRVGGLSSFCRFANHFPNLLLDLAAFAARAGA